MKKKTGWARCPVRFWWGSSENKLQGELNQPWISTGHGRVDRAEIGTTKILGGEPELRVVKQIEELRPELKTVPFGKICPLEYGEIKVVDSGRPERGIHA